MSSITLRLNHLFGDIAEIEMKQRAHRNQNYIMKDVNNSVSWKTSSRRFQPPTSL